jgi:hypothetical protein
MGLFAIYTHKGTPAKFAAIKAALLVVLSVITLAVISPMNAAAAPGTDAALKGALEKLAPEDKNVAFISYKWLRACITGPSDNTNGITKNEISANDWYSFTDGQITNLNGSDVGVYGDTYITNSRGTDGDLNCSGDDGKEGISMFVSLLRKMGYPSTENFLCSIGYDQPVPTPSGCKNYSGDMVTSLGKSELATNLDTWWTDAGASSLNAGGIGSGSYWHYFNTFTYSCKAQPGSASDSSRNFSIQAFNPGAQTPVTTQYYLSDSDITAGTTVTQYTGTSRSCSEIVEFINAKTDDAVKAMQKHILDNPTYIPGEAADPATPDIVGTTCGVEGVGYIVCPVFNFLAGVADATYGFIEGFLVTDITIVDTSSSNGTYTAWQVMRNVGNVGFVIVFLIIVFSQLTGAGISNYGVKKMLPRLVVAAILVNLSFFVAQLAVDVSNILGASIRDALELPVFDSFDGGLEQVLGQGNGFTNTAASIMAVQLGAGAVAGAGAVIYFGGIGLLIPVILSAVVAVIMTLFILVARQAIIILLIVVSPLAFLAMLLPNTENLFKQWRKIFVSMLLLYPAVALLFAGSQLAAAIVLTSSDGTTGQLVGLAIMVLPLFAVIPLLKASLNAIPAIGGMVQKLANGAISGTRKGSAQATKALGERAASSGNKFGQFASRNLFGRSREGRNRQSAARRAFEEPRINDIQDRWADEQIQNDAGALMGIVDKKGISSIEGRAAVSRLAQMKETDKLFEIRQKAEQKGGADMAAYERATRDHFGNLSSKDLRTVLSGEKLLAKYNGAKAVDMHNMSEKALDDGFEKSGNFKQTLIEALSDPDQSRYFDVKVRNKYAGEVAKFLGGKPGAAGGTPATPAGQPGSAGGSVPTTPPQATGSGPGGLVLPGDNDFKIPR